MDWSDIRGEHGGGALATQGTQDLGQIMQPPQQTQNSNVSPASSSPPMIPTGPTAAAVAAVASVAPPAGTTRPAVRAGGRPAGMSYKFQRLREKLREAIRGG